MAGKAGPGTPVPIRSHYRGSVSRTGEEVAPVSGEGPSRLAPVRRLSKALIALGAAVAISRATWRAAGSIRRLLSRQSPRHALDGSGPLVGSLDTWPEVPRAPVQSDPPGPSDDPRD
jgi:hypothetical protein